MYACMHVSIYVYICVLTCLYLFVCLTMPLLTRVHIPIKYCSTVGVAKEIVRKWNMVSILIR